MRLFFSSTLIFLLAVFLAAFTSPPEDIRTVYAKTITAADLKMHLSIIASDAYEGRETGEKGQKMAADYIASEFKSFGIPGLPMLGNDTSLSAYFEDVPLLRLQPGGGKIETAGKTYSFGKDYYYTSGAEDCDMKTSEVVFAGYGIQDSLYRDYDDLDVKGKTVIILSGEPKLANGNSMITGKKENSSWVTNRRRKINTAKDLGAAALLVVLDNFAKSYQENSHYILSPTLQLYDDDMQIAIVTQPMPVLYISKALADDILKSGKQKKTIDKLSAKIAKKKKPARLSFSAPVSIVINRVGREIHSENVLGYIEGSDLKNELVVVTAHYDHLGKDSTVVFNGADDDGSGTVSVMEIAEAFACAKKEGHGPRRSMLFMTLTGEEKGLLGSKWYTSHPVFPLENTVVDLNIDMIGRVDDAHKTDTNYVYVIGSGMLSSELKQINEAENAHYTGLLLDYKYDAPNDPNLFYYRSDHYNFAKHDIPVAFYFNGVHADYHKETDEVQKINFPLMERRARLVFYTAWEIANRDKRLVVDKKTK